MPAAERTPQAPPRRTTPGRRGARGRVHAPAVRALLVLLGLLALAATPRAGMQPVTKVIGGVEVTLHTPWPDGQLGGWLPVRARLSNGRSERVDVRISATQSHLYSCEALSGLRLGPGETREVNWLLPVHAGVDTSQQVSVRIDDDMDVFRLPTDPGSSDLGAAYTLISRAIDDRTVLDPTSGQTVVEHHQLPADWRAYTSLARLILLTDEGIPADPVMDAILAWVAAGGMLQVVGEARGLDLPLDERFRWDDEGRTGIASFRHGFGWIQLADEPRPELTHNYGASKHPNREEAASSAAPGVFPGWLSWVSSAIPGLAALPFSLLATILVIFFLVMGPGQFTWIKRRSKPPVTLLWTTPLLGFGFSGLLVVASLFHQGLSVRQAITSVSWLDQTRHHVASLGRRTVFSGSVFDSVLRYGAGTAILHLDQGTDVFTPRAIGRPAVYAQNLPEDLYVDLDDGALSGGFLPVRAPATELFAVSTSARQRLGLELEDGRLHVVNALGVDVLDLWYQDEDGNTWALDASELPSGERRPLVVAELPAGSLGVADPGLRARKLGDLPRDDEGPASWPALGEPDLTPVQPRCYVALLADSPFDDDGGVERRDETALHVLFGDLGPRP